jgi:hypothetical protein
VLYRGYVAYSGANGSTLFLFINLATIAVGLRSVIRIQGAHR